MKKSKLFPSTWGHGSAYFFFLFNMRTKTDTRCFSGWLVPTEKVRENCLFQRRMPFHANNFTCECFCTQTSLHANAFAPERLYKRIPLHEGTFTHEHFTCKTYLLWSPYSRRLTDAGNSLLFINTNNKPISAMISAMKCSSPDNTRIIS